MQNNKGEDSRYASPLFAGDFGTTTQAWPFLSREHVLELFGRRKPAQFIVVSHVWSIHEKGDTKHTRGQ